MEGRPKACDTLLRGALLHRIILRLLFARGFFFFFLILLLLLLVGLVILTWLGGGTSCAEASGKCHDVYLLSCRGECHVLTVRPMVRSTYK